MAASVLRSEEENARARERLKDRGLSFLSPWWKVFLARRGLYKGLLIGDPVKSWDLLLSIEFLEKNASKEDAILDLGACSSEILPSLNALGFSRLSGIDLNPRLSEMPLQGEIDYRVGDFMDAPYPDGSFAALSSTSVIEHGLDLERLLDASARLLRPGGWFLASFDYWPEKIDTSGIKMFDLSWTIFSRAEIEELVERAATRGLRPAGPLELDAKEPVIDCFDRRYTFGWLALVKDGA
jgi:SAM-dependent methyltransferase